MTVGDSNDTVARRQDTDPVESRIERLWHAVCDLYPGVEVASRHAFDDSVLAPEDLAALDSIRGVRQAFRECEGASALTDGDRHFLADIDQRLSSLEGRAEILLLAVS